MKPRIILVTGATDGIGKTTAIKLAELGQTVIIHGRNKSKCEDTLNEIVIKTNNNNCSFVVGNLASFDTIHSLSEEIHSKYNRIDTLLNNAGIYMNNREMNESGIELTFAVNHLAVFLLTHLLFDLVRKSEEGRIVTVSSLANVRGSIHLNDLNLESTFNGYRAYSQSKLANILFAFELAEKIRKFNITSNALHPGVITTKLLKTGFNISGSSTEEGAKTSIYLSISDEVKNVTGKYFDKQKQAGCNVIANDIELRSKLWNVSEELVKINSNDFIK